MVLDRQSGNLCCLVKQTGLSLFNVLFEGMVGLKGRVVLRYVGTMDSSSRGTKRPL